MLRVAGWYSTSWQYWVEFGLFLIGIVFAIFKKQAWLIVFSWTGLYFLAYTLLGVTSYYWYYAPLVPGWVIGIGLGTSFVSWFLSRMKFQILPSWHKVSLGIIGSLIFALFVAQVIDVQKMSQRVDPRYTIYRTTGEWLAENTPEGATVGALEVGIIGYYAQRYMIDFAGLIQPNVATQMKTDTTYDDTAVWAVQTYQPEYLVLIEGVHPRLKAEIVDSNCHLVKNFAGLKYDFSSDIKVYTCQYP